LPRSGSKSSGRPSTGRESEQQPTEAIRFQAVRDASDELAQEAGCYFSAEHAERPILFIERFCVQSKGRWAGQRLVLMDWERDFLMRLFGWRRESGLRRYASAYLEVAKKNGKSTLISALALFLLVADGEGAPEVYLNAVDREQAGIVFDESARMVAASPLLAGRLEVIPSRGLILSATNQGKIKKNSADAPSKDGVSASASIFDELHRFKNRALWDVFQYAGASREQPIRIVITTAGEEEEGVWWEQRDYSERVCAGLVSDWSHLGVVYRADPKDNFESPEVWRKANPSLGVTIAEEVFQRELQAAKPIPSAWGNFLRLRLNVVMAGDTHFLTLESWDACSGAPVNAASGRFWLGGDLSDTQDLTALVRVSGDLSTGLDVWAHFYLPGDNIVALERRHGLPYRVWAEQGFITLTPGNVIDYGFLRGDVCAQVASGDCAGLWLDPYNATKLGLELRDQDGVNVQFVRQGFLSLSPPTKELLRLVLAGLVRHGGNPILRAHAAAAVVVKDAAGNLKLHKEKSRKKIDGVSALVNALAGFTSSPESERSVYEEHGIIWG